ncbi:hypothetical protein [Leifsonia sp. P73]|uniref:hypothetical protein n=1 Tax=Leifsonia sp. P73 TaxID=3423959 RepID=UPI003DA3015B
MTEEQEAGQLIAKLRQEIAEVRRKRMSAQKTIATTPVLQVALERASRDRSSGATAETDQLRDTIQTLSSDIVHEIREIDKIRVLFANADSVYPELPQRPRLVAEFNVEADWRRSLITDERLAELRIVLPEAEVIS